MKGMLLVTVMFALCAGRMGWAEHTIMRIDGETLKEWNAITQSLPKTEIKRQLKTVKRSHNLLSHLSYIPSERNQGNCGDCWVWAGTGVMEIALSVQNGIDERLSPQYFNSCGTNGSGEFPCCGGLLDQFASWYSSDGKAIPWSNANAAFADAGTAPDCSQGPAVSCSSISLSPYYAVNSISAFVIPTYGVGQAAAIANIKNVLDQNKAIYFGFYIADNAGWDAFFNFWDNYGETALWDYDNVAPYGSGTTCGRTWTSGEGGHAVLCVGYDDSDPSQANHYWIMVNSWLGGNRPNNIFRVKMYTDYDCAVLSGGLVQSLNFQTLDISLSGPYEPVSTPTPTPAPPPALIRVDTDRSDFYASCDAANLYLSTETFDTPAYGFVRVVTPYYGTVYLTARGRIYAYPMPYLPFPIIITAPYGNWFLTRLWWMNLYPGTYYLESGAVDAYTLEYLNGVYWQAPMYLW